MIGVLGWLYLVVLWLTWTPVGDGPPEILWRPPRSWVPFLGNVLLFAPLGFAMAVHKSVRLRSRGRADIRGLVGLVALTAALLSMAVELGQFRVPGRNVAPWDVVLNAGGAALAAWVGARLARSELDGRRLVAAAMGVVWTGVLLFLMATGFTASRMLVLSDWNEDYVVFAGDEPSGQRAYDGSVADARICAGPADVKVCAGPGATPEERRTLAEVAQDTQAVRLSAVVTSRGPQAGDARIVTFSMDHLHRNATLYQNGRDLILRLRTPLGGTNGTGLEFVLPDAVPDDVRARVHGVFRMGRIDLVVEEEGVVEERGAARTAVDAGFPIGPLSGWWLVRSLPENRVEPGTLRRVMLVSAAAFSLPLGLGAVLLLGRGPVLLRALGGGVAAPLLLVLLASALGISVSVQDAAYAFGFGVMGGVMGLVGAPGRRQLGGLTQRSAP